LNFLLLDDHFRCFIDDTWWPGIIVKREAFDLLHENSPFQCYIIRWDNGENEERLSPWDIFECDDSCMRVLVIQIYIIFLFFNIQLVNQI
jgi:hypothetical protein